MSYNHNSSWNEKNEIRCLIIFKKLLAQNFPRNKQMEYSKAMSLITDLSAGNISAKVSNYKSVAGINNSSNASQNTVNLYKKHEKLTVEELEKFIL